MKTTLRVAAACAASLLLAASAIAQSFPTKPVTIVVPFAAGGGGDMITRAVSARMAEQMKQSFLVENRVGAGGTIGMAHVAKSRADGYTLLQGGDHVTLGKALHRNLGFDPMKDLVPVAGVSVGPHVVIAHPGFEANNLKEMLALAKSKPGSFGIGTPGVGTAQDLFAAMLKSSSGVEVATVPYKGGGAMINDVLGGHVKVGVIGLLPAMQHIRSGRLKALAVTSPTRTAQLPNVESVSETIAGLKSLQWIAWMAPSGTPADVIDRLARETQLAVADPKVRDLLTGAGLEPFMMGQRELVKFMQEDFDTFDTVVRRNGIKAE
jgi:tripartite-type tricarboxylate transporter receptor subunit TctC